MPASHRLCCRQGCGRYARWQNRRTKQIYCPDHAADVAGIVVIDPFDPATAIHDSIEHGTARGYDQELRAGIPTCASCKLASKKRRILGGREVAA